MGVFGVGFYNITFFLAEKHLSANLIAIIFSFSPCLTTLLASIIFKQPVTIVGYCGILLALIGNIGVINFSSPTCHKYICQVILTNLSGFEIYPILMSLFNTTFNLLHFGLLLLMLYSQLTMKDNLNLYSQYI